jgi:hypothetical protein
MERSVMVMMRRLVWRHLPAMDQGASTPVAGCAKRTHRCRHGESVMLKGSLKPLRFRGCHGAMAAASPSTCSLLAYTSPVSSRSFTTHTLSHFPFSLPSQSFLSSSSSSLSIIGRFFLTSKSFLEESFDLLLSSTMKKRRTKMNKHRLKKRKKEMRKNTKITRN